MTLPNAGSPINLAQLQTEFGGSNPIGLAEYYRGGSYVPSSASVPASGKIELDDFYGFAIAPAYAIGDKPVNYSAGNSGTGTKVDWTYTVPAFTSPATYRLSWSITAEAAYGWTYSRTYYYKNGVLVYKGQVGDSGWGSNDSYFRYASGTRSGNHSQTIQGGDTIRIQQIIYTRDSNAYAPNHSALSCILERTA